MAANPNFQVQNSQKVAGMWPSLHALLDEGSLFLMSSTDAAAGKAAGTGIATTTSVVDDAATASATHAQNVPVMYFANRGAPSDANATTIYPLALKMTVTAAPTTASVWNYALRADTSQRYSSGGTAMNAINLSTGNSRASAAQCFFGAVVTNLPSSNQHVLGSGQIQSSIPVVKDVWIFTFGDMTMPSSILTASAAKNINIPCFPFSIGPGWNFTLEMWGAANAGAPAWEFDFLYAERPAGL